MRHKGSKHGLCLKPIGVFELQWLNEDQQSQVSSSRQVSKRGIKCKVHWIQIRTAHGIWISYFFVKFLFLTYLFKFYNSSSCYLTQSWNCRMLINALNLLPLQQCHQMGPFMARQYAQSISSSSTISKTSVLKSNNVSFVFVRVCNIIHYRWVVHNLAKL